MEDKVVINPADTEIIGFAPLGEVFSSTRNAKKLALKDVSNNLRLSIKQIEALENNEFSKLPPAMITRGFIRNYARLLELEAEPLLASYRARIPDVTPSSLSVKTSMNQVMPNGTSTSSFKYVWLGFFVIFFAVAWIYFANYKQKETKHNVEYVAVKSGSEPVTETIPLPEVALPIAERQSQGEVVDAQIDVNSVKKNTSDAIANTSQVRPIAVEVPLKVESSNKQPAINPVVITQNLQMPKEASDDFNGLKEKVAQKDSLTSLATGSDANVKPTNLKVTELSKRDLKTDSTIGSTKAVNLAVTEQTWVRVTDKSGLVVYEKMLQANSEDGFNGSPPFKLLIGNAKATKLTFLGQNIDLTSKTKNNVARITLE